MLFVLYVFVYGLLFELDFELEWDLVLLVIWCILECVFEDVLCWIVFVLIVFEVMVDVVGCVLFEFVVVDFGLSLFWYIVKKVIEDQVREMFMQCLVYMLCEVDLYLWVIFCLEGCVKVVFVEIQFDEYGGGCFQCVYVELFVWVMWVVGMDVIYGVYIDDLLVIMFVLFIMMLLFGFN